MPSLKELEDFKTSFRKIGNEAAVLAAQNLPMDDLPLPDSEPSPSPFTDDAAPGPLPGTFEADFPDFPDLPDEAAGDELSGEDPGDDFDFGAFLDTIPDDLPAPAFDEPSPASGGALPADTDFAGDFTAFDEPSPESGGALADTDFAGDFAAFDEPPAASGGALPPEESPGGGFEDLPDFSDFSGGDAEDPFASPEGLLDGFADDVAAGRETPDEPGLPNGISADGIPAADSPAAEPDFSADLSAAADLDLPDDAFDLPPEAPLDLSEDDFSLPDASFDLPEDFGAAPADETPGGEAAAGEAGENLSPPELPAADMPFDGTLLDAPQDSFDTFNIGDEAGGAELRAPEEQGEAAGAFPDLDEFGIDDIFTPPAAASPGAPGASPAAPRGAGAQPSGGRGAAPEVEEINLTEDELERLRQTLDSYPLNLRIACEEIIAEQAVAPELMSALVKLLVRGGPPREAASLGGKILGRSIPIPRGFEKKTGEALEEEQAGFPYIFVHKFLPVLRLFLAAGLAAACLFYLAYQFIYTPLRADSIYRLGYERIGAGDYTRANERFNEAFRIRRVKDWFYRYAEAFRDSRQYLYAEEKYDELLRFYPRDKKGALDYAAMETNYLRNYDKADRIIRANILDYAVDDREGLLALGDNNLAWGEIEGARYEAARQAYARLLERYGWQDPIVERMMLYFIRTDNLGEVIPLQQYFTGSSKRKISPPALAELGGYLLDKRLEEPRGVPDANIERIEGIRDILLQAVEAAPSQPEPHYHLARYFNRFGNAGEERQTLEAAVRAFDRATEESPRRTAYRIDAERRYARVLASAREFFAAEEHLTRGIGVYRDALSRRLLSPSPEGGRLYADLGDLEYFVKSGDMETALDYYREAEQNLWAPAEMQYRMGSAHYHLGQWAPALDRFFTAAAEMPLNRRLLHALGNVSYIRGNYFAAQGYYNRLLDLLDAERARFPLLVPSEREDHLELAERMMVARNNMGVTLEALSSQTGNPSYRSGALGLYAESARAWDALTRDPQTMIRSGAGDLSMPGINLAYLNSRNILYPQSGYEPQIFRHIDKDVLEPSDWETLAPPAFRLSDQLAGPTGTY
jgi:tetratricopeptide (TPR) repeat protein